MKEPVKRKRAMFAETAMGKSVMPSVGGIGGGNSTEAKPCHGSESIPRQIEEEKCFPGVLRDHEVDDTQEGVDMTDTVSVEDFRLYLKEVGMTQRDFARFTRTPYDTVRGWARRAARIPGTAVSVLVMLRRDKTLAATCRATGWEPLW